MYSDRLKREIKEIQLKNPKIKLIFDELKRIDNIHPYEFDNDTEQEHLKYKRIYEILNK